MDHVVNTNIKHNPVNDVIDNELKFDRSNSLANNPVKDTLHIVTIMLRGRKKSRQTLSSGLTFLWDSGATKIMIKCKHINPYKSKLSDNRVKYSTDDVPYRTKDVSYALTSL